MQPSRWQLLGSCLVALVAAAKQVPAQTYLVHTAVPVPPYFPLQHHIIAAPPQQSVVPQHVEAIGPPQVVPIAPPQYFVNVAPQQHVIVSADPQATVPVSQAIPVQQQPHVAIVPHLQNQAAPAIVVSPAVVSQPQQGGQCPCASGVVVPPPQPCTCWVPPTTTVIHVPVVVAPLPVCPCIATVPMQSTTIAPKACTCDSATSTTIASVTGGAASVTSAAAVPSGNAQSDNSIEGSVSPSPAVMSTSAEPATGTTLVPSLTETPAAPMSVGMSPSSVPGASPSPLPPSSIPSVSLGPLPLASTSISPAPGQISDGGAAALPAAPPTPGAAPLTPGVAPPTAGVPGEVVPLPGTSASPGVAPASPGVAPLAGASGGVSPASPGVAPGAPGGVAPLPGAPLTPGVAPLADVTTLPGAQPTPGAAPLAGAPGGVAPLPGAPPTPGVAPLPGVLKGPPLPGAAVTPASAAIPPPAPSIIAAPSSSTAVLPVSPPAPSLAPPTPGQAPMSPPPPLFSNAAAESLSPFGNSSPSPQSPAAPSPTSNFADKNDVQPAPAPSQANARFELFFDLDYGTTDLAAFKAGLLAGFRFLGAGEEDIARLTIGLRDGSVIASIEGPSAVIERLTKLPLESMTVMGHHPKLMQAAPMPPAPAVAGSPWPDKNNVQPSPASQAPPAPISPFQLGPVSVENPIKPFGGEDNTSQAVPSPAGAPVEYPAPPPIPSTSSKAAASPAGGPATESIEYPAPSPIPGASSSKAAASAAGVPAPQPVAYPAQPPIPGTSSKVAASPAGGPAPLHADAASPDSNSKAQASTGGVPAPLPVEYPAPPPIPDSDRQAAASPVGVPAPPPIPDSNRQAAASPAGVPAPPPIPDSNRQAAASPAGVPAPPPVGHPAPPPKPDSDSGRLRPEAAPAQAPALSAPTSIDSKTPAPMSGAVPESLGNDSHVPMPMPETQTTIVPAIAPSPVLLKAPPPASVAMSSVPALSPMPALAPSPASAAVANPVPTTSPMLAAAPSPADVAAVSPMPATFFKPADMLAATPSPAPKLRGVAKTNATENNATKWADRIRTMYDKKEEEKSLNKQARDDIADIKRQLDELQSTTPLPSLFKPVRSWPDLMPAPSPMWQPSPASVHSPAPAFMPLPPLPRDAAPPINQWEQSPEAQIANAPEGMGGNASGADLSNLTMSDKWDWAIKALYVQHQEAMKVNGELRKELEQLQAQVAGLSQQLASVRGAQLAFAPAPALPGSWPDKQGKDGKDKEPCDELTEPQKQLIKETEKATKTEQEAKRELNEAKKAASDEAKKQEEIRDALWQAHVYGVACHGKVQALAKNVVVAQTLENQEKVASSATARELDQTINVTMQRLGSAKAMLVHEIFFSETALQKEVSTLQQSEQGIKDLGEKIVTEIQQMQGKMRMAKGTAAMAKSSLVKTDFAIQEAAARKDSIEAQIRAMAEELSPVETSALEAENAAYLTQVQMAVSELQAITTQVAHTDATLAQLNAENAAVQKAAVESAAAHAAAVAEGNRTVQAAIDSVAAEKAKANADLLKAQNAVKQVCTAQWNDRAMEKDAEKEKCKQVDSDLAQANAEKETLYQTLKMSQTSQS